MKRELLIHYGELGLKGENKQYFVKKLKEFLRAKLQKFSEGDFSIIETLGRIMIPLLPDFDEDKYVEILSAVPGVKNFQFVYTGPIEFEKLGKKIWKELEPQLNDMSGDSFRVKVKRSQLYPKKTPEIERELGAVLLRNGIDRKVKMKGADLEVNVELFNETGFFSFKKYKGLGGLPSNTGSKLICMLSSGIDSPVAAYKMIKRGARVIFLHFHAYPYADLNQMEHVKELVEILSKYQFDTKLYMVPFGEIQKKIAVTKEIPAKYRVVLYRRLMFRIAEKFAKKNRAKGLVTGENFGQVASQTAENMFAIQECTSIPIYQPLISMDKEEIINEAEKIGTFEISKLPCDDTCTMFSPKKPVLKADPYDLRKLEEFLLVEEMVEKAFEETEVIEF
jgi:tRNA uracil 4-sulfurtransferase